MSSNAHPGASFSLPEEFRPYSLLTHAINTLFIVHTVLFKNHKFNASGASIRRRQATIAGLRSKYRLPYECPHSMMASRVCIECFTRMSLQCDCVIVRKDQLVDESLPYKCQDEVLDFSNIPESVNICSTNLAFHLQGGQQPLSDRFELLIRE
jgi:hypothetical protein